MQKAAGTRIQLPSVRGHFECVYLHVLNKGTLGFPAGVPVTVGCLPYSPQHVWANIVAVFYLAEGWLVASEERT